MKMDELVSDAMCHSLDTARAWYRRPDRSTNSAIAQSAIGEYWASGGEPSDSLQQQQKVAGSLSSEVSPEKVASKLKRLRDKANVPHVRKKLSTLPEMFQKKGNKGNLSEGQLEIIYHEYWLKGNTTASKIRMRRKERKESEELSFTIIQRKIAAWKLVEKEQNK